MERELRARLRRIYVENWPYWEEPATQPATQERQLEVLRQNVTRLLRHPATVQTTPRDINNYYDIECPLSAGLPPSRAELTFEEGDPEPSAEYFQLLLSAVAPVVAGVWHRFSHPDGEPRHEMFDLVSPEWFATHPEHEAAARELAHIARGLGLTLLGWDVTLQPADADWPVAPLMPEAPDLRHYLFKGYYDDWGGISKPVRDP
ncbi:hypothetical protein LZ198_17855 [Myxococcus sp. K15C18031901]|uniref:hypothetical protein n=1 Tax=Myxococcus dinghuensis TaxID=2906761 RepID=UPI0020A7FA33|nr:hypothetical protein [Myxococcus dinghuensis]MCP3100737.1 hypothetical protein [Myxococcus dinghuensis]